MQTSPPPPPNAADEIPASPTTEFVDSDDGYTDEEVEEEIIEEVIEEIIEEEIQEEEDSEDEYEELSGDNSDHEDGRRNINSGGIDGKTMSHTSEKPEANKSLTHSLEGTGGDFKMSGTSDEELTPEKMKIYGNCNYRYSKSHSHSENAASQFTLESANDGQGIVPLTRNQTTEDSKLNRGASSGSFSNEIQGAEIRRHTTVTEKDVAVFPFSREPPDALNYTEEIKQVGSGDDKKRTISRLSDGFPEGWIGSLPSDTGIDNGNKRPAIICDFFSRGWCIKGNSCRFLHIKDNANTTAQTSEHSFKPSLLTSERLPSHQASSRLGPAFNSESLSLRGITSYSHSFLSGSMDFRTPKYLPLHASSSSFFGSEAEKSLLTNAIGEQSCFAEHWTKFIPYNWEPSIPFRPSFFVSSILGVTSGSLRNSSELPNLRDRSYKSLYIQGASVLNATDKIHSDYGTGIAGPDCNNDKHSASSHDKNNGRVLDKECSTNTANLVPVVADLEGNSAVDGQSGTARKEDRPLDFAESHNATQQSDRFGNRSQLVTKWHKQKYPVSGDQEDVNVQKETEVLQHFRVALIEFVKELVKPIWREGRLSRDAHKIIVKRASDKVISTMPTGQIPASPESIKLFFSSSRTKIMTLVEGYVDKFGKRCYAGS